jgi:hypothetical protein
MADDHCIERVCSCQSYTACTTETITNGSHIFILVLGFNLVDELGNDGFRRKKRY